MDCFKYLFRENSTIWILFLFISFVTINCQNGCGCNGCTTSVIVDQEALKKKVDGINLKVVANKNRVTNRKLRLTDENLVDKTIWFTVDYFLKVEKRPEIKKICEFEVPENADLKKALVDFTIKFSPDKKHFAVGLNNHVYDFFHMLENGVPFSSGSFYLKDSNNVYLSDSQIEFDRINWKLFPNPDALFDSIIIPNNFAVWNLSCNKDNVLKLLSEMPAGNRHEIFLIENWFCEIADMHFTQSRVEEIIKVSPIWKKTALNKLIYSVDNSVSDMDDELDKSLDMILWINDSKTLNKTDSIVFDDYFAAGNAGDYLLERMKDKTVPLNSKIQTALLSKAKNIAANFQQQTDIMHEQLAIDILLFKQENDLLKSFINKNINYDLLLNDFVDITYSTIRRYEVYPKDLQAIMVKKYLEVAQNPAQGLSVFDITEIVEFLKDKIPCKELKKIVELHKANLYTFTMPKGC